MFVGGETLKELRSVFATAESTVTGFITSRASMSDISDLGALLQRSGYALPVVDSVKLITTYETPFI